MKLENLVRKGRTGLAAGFFGLTAIGVGACATTISEGEGLILLGEVLGITADNEEGQVTGQLMSQLGSMWYQKEVVKEGRTQINVNQQNPNNTTSSGERYAPAKGYVWVNPEDPNDRSVKRIFGSGFSFRWVDYNRNKAPNPNKGEYIGRQTRFRKDESMAFWLIYEAEEPFHQELKIYGPEGRPALQYYIDPSFSRSGICVYNLEGRCNNNSVEFFGAFTKGMTNGLNKEEISWLLKTFGEGEYSATWRVEGKIMDSISFELIY